MSTPHQTSPTHSVHFVGLLASMLATTLVVMAFAVPDASACDACNEAFKQEILNERSETPAGQDIIQAMDNQAEFNSLSFETTDSDTAVADQALAQTGQPIAQAGEPTQVARADTPDAPAHTGGDAARSARDFDELYNEDEPFIDIIERDEGLANTPPTGFVSQDVEPDEEVTIELDEGKTYLGQGVMYDGFLLDGSIPGPNINVEQGDVVRMNFENTGTVPHGASIHTGYAQTSAHVGQIDPGETKSVTFRATYPGVYMYHCAPGGHAIPMHVMAGQYGMMTVEPTEQKYKLEEELGQEPDLSLYMLQNELYASGKDAVESTNEQYTMFNGRVFGYVEDPIAVEPGDYVRLYFLNVGPNLLSTFHIVGIIWDYAYWQGHPDNRLTGGQSVTAGPTDSWVVEFRIPPAEGPYTMLSHHVGSTSRGAIGILAAEEDADGPDVVKAEAPEYTEDELQEFADEAVRTISLFAPGTLEQERPEVYGSDVDEVFVDIKGNAYAPNVIEIEEGTKVTWTNEDVFTYLDGEFAGIHNAIGTSGPEEFATDMLAHGETDSVVFDEPGEYEYICTPHPYMEGKIIVRESEEDDDAEAAGGCSTTSATPAAPLAVVALVLMGLAVIRRNQQAESIIRSPK